MRAWDLWKVTYVQIKFLLIFKNDMFYNSAIFFSFNKVIIWEIITLIIKVMISYFIKCNFHLSALVLQIALTVILTPNHHEIWINFKIFKQRILKKPSKMNRHCRILKEYETGFLDFCPDPFMILCFLKYACSFDSYWFKINIKFMIIRATWL